MSEARPIPDTREPIRGNLSSSQPPTRDGSLVQVPSVPLYGDTPTGDLAADGSLVRAQPHTLDQTAVRRLAHVWGKGDNGYFACPLPGHDGGATLVRGDRGEWCLACCHGRRRSLAEVRAVCAYGQDRIYSNIELAVWWRRLAYELGALVPVAVELPELPPDSPPTAAPTRNGFALLVGLRRVDHPPRPVAYSVRFAAAWTGLTHAGAAAGLRALREFGVIRETERRGRVRLYEPAPPEGASR